MDADALYQTIFRRKSVRALKTEPLPEASMTAVLEKLKNLRPLVPGIKTELSLMRTEDVKGLFKVDAPHYLGLFSEKKDGYLANAGFLLQQMDLFFSANGIGSCWQGGPKPNRAMREHDGMEFIIMLAFGAPAEPLHRSTVAEFKREPLEKITNLKGRSDLLEPARLAPSGMNNQPWYFTGSDQAIHVFAHDSIITKNMNRISAGIALCHLWLAGMHHGIGAELLIDGGSTGSSPRGYGYVATVKLRHS